MFGFHLLVSFRSWRPQFQTTKSRSSLPANKKAHTGLSTSKLNAPAGGSVLFRKRPVRISSPRIKDPGVSAVGKATS